MQRRLKPNLNTPQPSHLASSLASSTPLSLDIWFRHLLRQRPSAQPSGFVTSRERLPLT